MVELAYSISGAVSLVNVDGCFKVQAKIIPSGSRGAVGWKTAYGVWDREKAVQLFETFIGARAKQ